MDPETTNKNKLWTFFSHPIVSMLSLCIGIVGVLLTIYFYNVAKKERELCFYVYPDKIFIANCVDGVSNLSVSFKGKPLSEPVIATKVAIWNAGNEGIKGANILKPIMLCTKPPCRILEARLVGTSRPEILGIKFSETEIEKGKLGISWNILEKGDGIVLQLMYVGTSDEFDVTGIVEGQKEIRKIVEPGMRGWKKVGMGSLCLFCLIGGLVAPISVRIFQKWNNQ